MGNLHITYLQAFLSHFFKSSDNLYILSPKNVCKRLKIVLNRIFRFYMYIWQIYILLLVLYVHIPYII